MNEEQPPYQHVPPPPLAPVAGPPNPPTTPPSPTPPEPTHEPPKDPKQDSSNPDNLQKSAWHEFFSTVGILVTALVVALLIIAFVFRSYQVDGPSMENTLHNSDKLIIWKVPRTWATITRHDYIPGRGDVIVFTESGLGQFGQQDTKQLIKRVIGLPGDRVVVKDGEITVYNKEHPDGFKPDKTLEYGKDIPETSGNVDVTLGKKQLFVSGDNRPDSLDSRSFGPIEANQVVGKLVIRVFPLSNAKIF